MTESEQATVVDDGEIDIRALFRVLWAGKWIVISITLAAGVVAAAVALSLPNIYRAEALLAPNDQDGAGGLSALASQYGGIASLAGIDLRGGSTDKTALSLEILKSRKFISEFIENHDILISLMAVNAWDPASGDLTIDSDVYDVEAKQWVRDVGPRLNVEPSFQEAHREFTEILTISQDKISGFITISLEHYSPDVAKQWVDWLIEDLNMSIMHQDVAEAEQAIEYLNKQIARTSLADLQNVFFSLIEEQTKTVMLAKVSPEYMFKTLDPAVAPELKAKPKRALIVVFSMLLAGLFSIFVVFLRNSVVERK